MRKQESSYKATSRQVANGKWNLKYLEFLFKKYPKGFMLEELTTRERNKLLAIKTVWTKNLKSKPYSNHSSRPKGSSTRRP